jgi:cell wall-associated NlpC family hydrolase
MMTEMRSDFLEMFSDYDEFYETSKDYMEDDPEFLKEAVAMNHIKALAKVLANCGTTVGNFLNATANLAGGDGITFQFHNETPSKVEKTYKVGDHLRINRGVYTHHGIYAGDGKVIHYSQGYDKIPEIREVPFAEFAGVSKVEVVPESESPMIYSAEEAVKRAYTRLGEKSYNLIYNNCENFVRWCRAGC